MIPEEIKYIICEYVSQTWVNEAIWLFPSLKKIQKCIPTYLMHKNNIRKDRLRKKTASLLGKRLVKMKRGKDRHSVFFNKLGYDEIQTYCNKANSKKNTIPEKLIQIRPVSTGANVDPSPKICPVLCYPILCLGYVYSMSVLSDISYSAEVPYLFIDFSIYN